MNQNYTFAMNAQWRFVHPLKRRWYLVWVTQDLFGEQVLVLRWGSLDRKLGGGKCEPFDARRLKAILKRRQRHGYSRLDDR